MVGHRYGLAAVAVAFALLVPAAAPAAASYSVTLSTTGPQPATVTAALGDTVTFVNGEPGNVVVSSPRAGFTSPALAPGQAFAHVLTTSGQYAFVQAGAKVHRGRLVVRREGTVTLVAGKRSISYGSSVELSGRAVPIGFSVKIQHRPAGERDWSDLLTVEPDADGRYAATVHPAKGARYRSVLFDGELVSDRILVDVRPTVALRPMRWRAPTSTSVVFSVRLAPPSAASAVDLVISDRRSKSWRRVATGAIDSQTGRATLRWRFEPGRTLLQARVDRRTLAKGYVTAMSNQVVVVGVGADPRKTRRR